MAFFTFTFAPGTIATVAKIQGKWIVQSVNDTEVVITVEDVDGNGLLSDTEWNAATGGDGNDIGGPGYLFAGGGTSGLLYSTSGDYTFTVGQNVSAIRAGLTNNYDIDVSGIICFTPGTMITTPNGDRLVEHLQIGDLVITADNGLQPIRWIGRKRITGARLFAKPHLKPVKIRKGALGHNLPERDMWVSPQHRMHMKSPITNLFVAETEVLITAKSLINNNTILIDQATRSIEYIHILFDRHELVFANGALSESFYPGINAIRAMDAPTQSEVFEIFPELAQYPNTFGTMARPVIKPSEVALLQQAYMDTAA